MKEDNKMIILFFLIIGLVFEILRFTIRIAGKLAGAFFGFAIFLASISFAAHAVVLIFRLLPVAVLFMIAMSLLSFA